MFKIGEKIVCKIPSISLVKHEIYTVSFIKPNGGIQLKEVNPKSQWCTGFHPWRFEKLDHSFSKNLLAKITEEMLVLI